VFRISLPKGPVAGEGIIKAVYTDITGTEIKGQMILGAHPEWLSTGPLSPYDPLHQKLRNAKTVSDEDLKAEWKPFPLKGYDPYRRLNMEYAYGQLTNKYIYLCADIHVNEFGRYTGLLTVDDTGTVYINGKRAMTQYEHGMAEGRLMIRSMKMSKGRKRIFIRMYQSDREDPSGPDRDRHAWNNCAVKWLLRKSRHEHSEQIKWLSTPFDELKN
jgi:hypothetical protein